MNTADVRRPTDREKPLMGARRCGDEVQTWTQLREELEAAKARVLDARGRLKCEEKVLEGIIAKVMRYLDRR